MLSESFAVSAECVKDGVPQSVPIHSKVINGNMLTVYVLLDSSIAGELTDYRLLDKDGDIFMRMADEVEKPAKNLLLVTFKLALSEVFTGAV